MAATTHTVVKGDTLWSIAETYLGSGTKYKQLAAINNISNPDLIFIGQVIKLTNEGSGSSSGSSSSSGSNKVTINQFGALSTNSNTLFATWTWDKQSQTESYKVLWKYTTIDGIEIIGTNTNISVDKDYYAGSRQSTYQIPDGATKVTFQVKPISKTYKKNDKDTVYWTADWSSKKTYTNSTPLSEPKTPALTVDGYKLTATIDDVGDTVATTIEFKLVKNNTTVVGTKSASINTQTGYVSYSWSTSDAGSEYKVCARAVKGTLYSDWSGYSNIITTKPAAPSGFTTAKAQTETSVYLAWAAIKSAKTYEIEYALKKSYFDGTDLTTKKSGITTTYFEITGLETGNEYFFRLRAVNEDNSASDWSGISSVIIGTAPAAPTTWSSTTTAITGEELNLYWVHNSEDGSSQTYAELELNIGGVVETHTIKNSTDEDEKDKTSSYSVATKGYSEGTTILWKVRTAGVTKNYGEWSTQRTIDIYAQPSLELSFTDAKGNSIETLTTFPGYVNALPGPKTQSPIGYHLTVTSNSVYETVDNVGNTKYVNAGEATYSKHFDITDALLVELSPGNIDLENNISYTITCVASMDSGLRAEGSINFTVSWTDEQYAPNAEISIDEEVLSAHIRPYCMNTTFTYYQVTQTDNTYTKTSTAVDYVFGEEIADTFTTTGEQVFSGTDGDGNDIYYCRSENSTLVENVTLSVYRRTFDGDFIEIASGLDNSKNTTVTDPHPSLDFARYRIVATSTETGAVGYTDISEPVGFDSGIIQWAEDWTSFESTEEGALEQPSWSGSLLRLRFNLDVSESNTPDVQHISYIGREQQVAYYGTMLGHKATWNTDVDKEDKETLYALRRLQTWMGDVYIREPSGLGYWASVTVSFNQNHTELVIPVSINITRVEGGM